MKKATKKAAKKAAKKVTKKNETNKKTLLERAGIKRIPMENLKNVAKHLVKIEKILSSDKPMKKEVRKALTDYRWNCQQFLKNKGVNPKLAKPQKVVVAEISAPSQQMIFDNFLKQLDVVKITELVAERLKKEMQVSLQNEIAKIKPNKKQKAS